MPDYTIDIGYVHVGERIEGEWVCAENCPHPDHFDIEAPRQFGRNARTADAEGA